jgi:hypothetical protein
VSLSPHELNHEIGRLQRENELLREAVERLVEDRRRSAYRSGRRGIDWQTALANGVHVRRRSSAPLECELCRQDVVGGEEYCTAGTKGGRVAHAECVRRQAGVSGEPRWRWFPTTERMRYAERGAPVYATIGRSVNQLDSRGGSWFGRAWLDDEPVASVAVDGVTDEQGGRLECRRRLEIAIAKARTERAGRRR